MYNSVKWALMPWFRQKRINSFLQIMKPLRGARILDVGGLPSLNGIPGFWQQYKDDFNITLINLPGAFASFSNEELAPFHIIEADVSECPVMSNAYDIVFSNSVVEHVGSLRRQEGYANFVLASGRSFWIQTPSPEFPIEAHCNMPFWWAHSSSWRARKIKRWKNSGDAYLAKQMSITRPISKHRLQILFPNCSVVTERFLGIPKSYIAVGTI